MFQQAVSSELAARTFETIDRCNVRLLSPINASTPRDGLAQFYQVNLMRSHSQRVLSIFQCEENQLSGAFSVYLDQASRLRPRRQEWLNS